MIGADDDSARPVTRRRLGRWRTVAAMAAALAAPACAQDMDPYADSDGGASSNSDAGTAPPPPPPPPPPAPVVAWERGSLAPDFRLMPRAEYERFAIDGERPDDGAFTAADLGGNPGVAARMDAVGARIGDHRGTGDVTIIRTDEDRVRADAMPFRGHPSDVAIVVAGDRRRAFVPLGGDMMSAGDEVAVVDYTDPDSPSVARAKVGIRPRAVAAPLAVNGDRVPLVFVCNQYSNFLSILDARTGEALTEGGEPVEIRTQYHCTDLAFAHPDPSAPERDRQRLYVANQWTESVLRYELSFEIGDGGDPIGVTPVAVAAPEAGDAAGQTRVGGKLHRLALSQGGDALHVAGARGGRLASIPIAEGGGAEIDLGAPAGDLLEVAGSLLVATTTVHRGLPAQANRAELPDEILADPRSDGGSEVHPGARLDGTASYGVEDLRSGLVALSPALAGGIASTFTDDNDADAAFGAGARVLAGAQPRALARTDAGDRVFVAFGGSDLVQVLAVSGNGAGEVALASERVIPTDRRPYALAVDDERGHILVANWGGETLQVFAADTGDEVARIDLGYAKPAYPATAIETGEYLFYNAGWSNDGRKSCAGCHYDELVTDGLGFAAGTAAPTAVRVVSPTWNLFETDPQLWNGSLASGDQRSLFVRALTRGNCAVVAYGLVDGIASQPSARAGDPANQVSVDAEGCAPSFADGGTAAGLPDNFDDILTKIEDQRTLADAHVREVTAAQGLPGDLGIFAVGRLVSWYAAAARRLPPNPYAYLLEAEQLPAAVRGRLASGRQLFAGAAACAGCHRPDAAKNPFADGRTHGPGSQWDAEFIEAYDDDPRLRAILPDGIPEAMRAAVTPPGANVAPTYALSAIEALVPRCFDGSHCLSFRDPLSAADDSEETAVLELLVRLQLADPRRGFVPGAPVGAGAAVRTPSLRGAWWRARYLRHGRARSLAETILPPESAVLADGETGYAVSADGARDTHGAVSGLTAAQVRKLLRYVDSIE